MGYNAQRRSFMTSAESPNCCRSLMRYVPSMDLVTFIAEDVVGWIDDRFGRAAAWIVSILAVLALTVGAITIAVYLMG